MQNNNYQAPQDPETGLQSQQTNPISPQPIEMVVQPKIPSINKVGQAQPSTNFPPIAKPTLKKNSKNQAVDGTSFSQQLSNTSGVIISQNKNAAEATTCCETAFIYKVYPSIAGSSTEQDPSKKRQKKPILVIKQKPIPCKDCCNSTLDLHCFDPALGEDQQMMEFFIGTQSFFACCSCDEIMTVSTVTPAGVKKPLGKVVATYECKDYFFKVHDKNDAIVYSLVGGGCQNCCKAVKFDFYRGFREQKLDQQLVRYPKSMKENFWGDEGTFDITFRARELTSSRSVCAWLWP